MATDSTVMDEVWTPDSGIPPPPEDHEAGGDVTWHYGMRDIPPPPDAIPSGPAWMANSPQVQSVPARPDSTGGSQSLVLSETPDEYRQRTHAEAAQAEALGRVDPQFWEKRQKAQAAIQSSAYNFAKNADKDWKYKFGGPGDKKPLSDALGREPTDEEFKQYQRLGEVYQHARNAIKGQWFGGVEMNELVANMPEEMRPQINAAAAEIAGKEKPFQVGTIRQTLASVQQGVGNAIGTFTGLMHGAKTRAAASALSSAIEQGDSYQGNVWNPLNLPQHVAKLGGALLPAVAAPEAAIPYFALGGQQQSEADMLNRGINPSDARKASIALGAFTGIVFSRLPKQLTGAATKEIQDAAVRYLANLGKVYLETGAVNIANAEVPEALKDNPEYKKALADAFLQTTAGMGPMAVLGLPQLLAKPVPGTNINGRRLLEIKQDADTRGGIPSRQQAEELNTPIDKAPTGQGRKEHFDKLFEQWQKDMAEAVKAKPTDQPSVQEEAPPQTPEAVPQDQPTVSPERPAGETDSPQAAPQPEPIAETQRQVDYKAAGGKRIRYSVNERELRPGVMVDASISDHLRQINEAGFATEFSESGMNADHPGKKSDPRESGYVSFSPKLEEAQKQKILRAAQSLGLSVDDPNDTPELVRRESGDSITVRFPREAIGKWDQFTKMLTTPEGKQPEPVETPEGPVTQPTGGMESTPPVEKKPLRPPADDTLRNALGRAQTELGGIPLQRYGEAREEIKANPDKADEIIERYKSEKSPEAKAGDAEQYMADVRNRIFKLPFRNQMAAQKEIADATANGIDDEAKAKVDEILGRYGGTPATSAAPQEVKPTEKKPLKPSKKSKAAKQQALDEQEARLAELRRGKKASDVLPSKEQVQEAKAATASKEGSEPERRIFGPGEAYGSAMGIPLPAGVEEDLSAAVGKVVEAGKFIRQVFGPQGISAESKEMAGNVREGAARLALRHEQAKAMLEPFSKALMKMPQQARYDFIDAVEAGKPTGDPKLDQAAKSMRTLLDEARDRIRALGTGKLDKFIQDYFPHIWKDPAKAQDVFGVGKRPLEGSKAFLKKRTIPTTKDGLARGLEPVTDNPVDLVLLKLHEMNRYEMGQKILAEGKDRGYIKLARNPGQRPQGWVKINDPIGSVFQRRATTKADGTPGAPEYIHRGDYYAHPDAARILNNYLSPGLRGNAIFDILRNSSNALNMAQLGISAFHLTGSAINAVTSQVALAGKYLAVGRPIKAAKLALTSPLAPFRYFTEGSKVLREALNRPQGADFADVLDGLTAGGDRLRQDPIYRLGKGEKWMLSDSIAAIKKGRLLSGAMKFIPGVLEQISRPLMSEFIPRIKLGAAADMARFELDRLPQGATRQQLREQMRGVVDSVDNRLGEMIYDNLFWKKTLKDSLMLGTRSLGWNLGTLRELGGGALDIATKLPHGELTHRAAFTIALPLVTGTLGAMICYAYTGYGPQSLIDYIFPPTGKKDDQGNDQRLSLPTYMKDVFAVGKHPIQTVENKTGPLFSAMLEMYHNKDYYGNQIRNPDDPMVKQAWEEGKYLLKQFIPFSFRNAEVQQRGGEGLKGEAAAFFGVLPANKSITESKMEGYLHDQQAGREFPARTPDQAAKHDAKSQVRLLLEQQQPIPDELRGKLSAKDFKTVAKEAREGRLVKEIASAPLMDSIKAANLATDSEWETIKGPLAARFGRAAKQARNTYTPDEWAKVYKAYSALWDSRNEKKGL